jgi:hypothetical protein
MKHYILLTFLLLERTPWQRSHDLCVHLVDELDRLWRGKRVRAYSQVIIDPISSHLCDCVIPCLDLPGSIPGCLSLLKTVVPPNVLHCVKSPDLAEIGSDGFYKSLSSFQPSPPDR